MATMRDPKKAPTAFGSRQSPYLTSVSVATQSQASISRVTLSLRSPKSTPSTQCVILRYEEDQNDMPVRSIEGPEQGYTGYKHYTFLAKQHNFDTKPSLDHINYLASSFNVTDTDALHELGPEPVSDLTSLAYADYPARPPLQDKYSQPIYYGTTRNPSVFLAILRIAQLQNPKMDFPTEQLPRLSPWAADSLTPAPFLDTLEIQPEESDEGSDEEGDEINVAFLPYFYGECHGIVFWEYIQDFKRGQVLGSACVTACTEEDLRRYGLVDYIGLMDVKSALGPVGPQSTEGADVMHSVGVEKGRWLEKNVVEDWEEWRSGGARLGLVLCIGIVGWR